MFELFGCVWVAVARENSGEHWFSRPSEHVSPRRDQQRLAQATSRE